MLRFLLGLLVGAVGTAAYLNRPKGDASMLDTRPTTPLIDMQFDPKLDALSRSGSIVKSYLYEYPHRILSALRWLTPVARRPFSRWAIALRYDEVREVLLHDQEFPVPWREKMEEFTEGENFVLGMPRGDPFHDSRGNLYRDSYRDLYYKRYELLANAFPRTDVPDHVTGQAAKISKDILDKKGSQGFDAIRDLITAVPTYLCESYYGIQIPDKVRFANWILAISAYLFGPSSNTSSDAARARPAAACLSHAIRKSIASAKKDLNQGQVLPRMLRVLQKDREAIDIIHAQLFGMVLGFIPTNVLAGGNILETLLHRPEFLERTRAAALSGDDDLLWRCLREALRFRHINLGPLRACPDGYTFGAGGPRPIRIRPGSKIVASIQSAMFDPRRIERPHVFDPGRRDEDYMVFGVGQHWCLGAYIATAQLTQTFKELLVRGKPEPVDGRTGRMKRFGVFPLHLSIRIRPEP